MASPGWPSLSAGAFGVYLRGAGPGSCPCPGLQLAPHPGGSQARLCCRQGGSSPAGGSVQRAIIGAALKLFPCNGLNSLCCDKLPSCSGSLPPTAFLFHPITPSLLFLLSRPLSQLLFPIPFWPAFASWHTEESGKTARAEPCLLQQEL